MASSANGSGLVGWLAGNRNRAGFGLAALAIAVGAGVAMLASKYGRDYLAVEFLLGLFALLALAFGVLFAYRPRDAGSPRDEALAFLLAVGGMFGLILTLVGLVLLYQWWGSMLDWLREGKREGAKWVLPALALALAGLAVMFTSVQSARSEVRQSSALRRLVYGYNAVLTGILLFLILAVGNVFAYIKLPAVLDSSESSFSKLSERSEKILQSIERPVRVYLVMSTDSFVYSEMRPLLANAQGFCPQMQVEAVQPIRGTAKYDSLTEKYPQATSQGVLIVVGDDKKEQVGFIPGRDIIKGSQDKPTFEGEGAFITELSYLAEDKKKPVIYFTSNNAGEFEFQEGGSNNQESVSTLVRRLKERNFDVKPLKFELGDAKVPDDATVVVIPAPRSTFPKPAAEAIRNYVDGRKGKLIALFPPTSEPGQKAMLDTGLEATLASLRVEVTKERILTFPEQDDRVALTSCFFTLPAESRNASNPVAQALKGVRLPFVDSRVVRPAQAAGPPAGGDAEVLLQVWRPLPVLLETDMTIQPARLFEGLLKQGREAMQARVMQTPVSMAVTVAESAPSMPGMPPAGASKPRAVVFGNAWWIGNGIMDEQLPNPYYFNLFAASVDWLREKPTNIGFESKQYKSYAISPDAAAGRLLLLPPLFVLVGIVGLGTGVWVARRR